MVKNTTVILLVILFTGFFASTSMAIEVTAQVDRNPVIVNESFTLTITANDDLPQSTFRPDALMRDFVVGATSVDRTTRLIQGDLQRQTRWQVSLVARRPGNYQIPAFELGSARTEPIDVSVIVPDRDDDAARGPAFLTATVDTDEPYVQQQIRYEVKLHLAHQLESGTLSPPTLEHADIQQVGRDEESQEIINGLRYRVVTRTYLITPLRSGTFILDGSRFDGQIREQQPRSFTGFSRPQSVTVLADPIELNVTARPQAFDHHWLPSQQVVIEDESDHGETIVLGEPVNRRISVTAQGVRAEQLPDIQVQYPASLRYYPERTERESFSARGQRIAQATFRGALIPSEVGEFTIPETLVHWWDTETDSQQTARLPERQVTVVEPAGGVPTVQQQTPADENSAPVTTAVQLWWSPAATLFAALWFLTLLLAAWLWLRPRSVRRNKEQATTGLVPASSRKPLQQLKLACQKSDAKAARSALLNWANSRSERQINDLDALTTELNDSELTSQVGHLQQALYNGCEVEWKDGPALWQSIQRLHQKARSQQSGDPLPPLYPS